MSRSQLLIKMSDHKFAQIKYICLDPNISYSSKKEEKENNKNQKRLISVQTAIVFIILMVKRNKICVELTGLKYDQSLFHFPPILTRLTDRIDNDDPFDFKNAGRRRDKTKMIDI